MEPINNTIFVKKPNELNKNNTPSLNVKTDSLARKIFEKIAQVTNFVARSFINCIPFIWNRNFLAFSNLWSSQAEKNFPTVDEKNP